MQQQVLIIEDSKAQARLVEGIIASINCLPVVALNGETARKHFNSTLYDLVLLDMILPDANGLQLLREIKTSPNNMTPVVILSAVTDKGNIVDALSLGAHDYIAKPFHQTELIVRLKLHLNYHKINKQLQLVTLSNNALISNISRDLLTLANELLTTTRLLAKEHMSMAGDQRADYINKAYASATSMHMLLQNAAAQESA